VKILSEKKNTHFESGSKKSFPCLASFDFTQQNIHIHIQQKIIQKDLKDSALIKNADNKSVS